MPGEMIEIKGEDAMQGMVHGWFKAAAGLERCLERYTRAGGTHHLCLVYEEDTTAETKTSDRAQANASGDYAKKAILSMGDMLGWDTVIIE